MSCVYNLKIGHTSVFFNSEIELDDYLLSHRNAEGLTSRFGDYVFDLNVSPQVNVSLGIIEQSKAEAEELFKKKKVGTILTEDGREIEAPAPYIGINKYLSNFTIKYKDGSEEEHPLYPIFDEKNYWDKRKAAWAMGNFTSDEREALFGDDENHTITSDEEFERCKKEIESKWESQCLAGDAVHSVFLVYFSKAEDVFDVEFLKGKRVEELTGKKIGEDLYVKDILENEELAQDAVLIETLKSKLYGTKYQKRDKSYISFGELIDSDEKIDLILSQCKLFSKSIAKLGIVHWYPELKISGKVRHPENGCDTVIGIIDLLAVDKNGKAIIFDYKTSLKAYDDFAIPKKTAFTYQVGMYGKLLKQKGLFLNSGCAYNIVPIQLNDFVKDGSGRWTFSSATLNQGIIRPLDLILGDVNRNYMENLEEIIDVPEQTVLVPDHFLTNVVKTVQGFFPGYQQTKQYTEQQIVELFKREGVKQNPETKLWEFKPKGYRRAITAKTEAELINAVLELKRKDPERRVKLTTTVATAIQQCLDKGSVEGVDFPKHIASDNIDVDWLKETIRPYVSTSSVSNWIILGEDPKNTSAKDDPFTILRTLGIITLKNKNGQLNFIKITNNDFYESMNFGKNRNSLAGAFQPDIYYQSRPNDLMLQCNLGNIEMVETMVALNQLSEIFKDLFFIGQILIVDPYHLQGMSASNKELMYCFNELWKQKSGEGENHFLNGDIKMASVAQLAATLFDDVMRLGHSSDWDGEFQKFLDVQSCQSQLDKAISIGDPQEQIEALERIRRSMEKDLSTIGVAQDSKSLSDFYTRTYNLVLLALAELKGHNFRLQIRDHGKWWEGITDTFKNGLNGSYLDNPGNLKSETLNLLTKLVTEAYQNVRQDMQEPTAKLRQLTIKLKKKKNFGWMTENTYGNEADLYKNMYREDVEGDLVFKNPWKDKSLTPEEREYLKEALKIINSDRLNYNFEKKTGSYSEEEILHMIDTDDYNFFKVPLARGDSSTKETNQGWLSSLADRLKSWLPKEAFKRAKEKAEGVVDKLYNTEQATLDRNNENLYLMTNLFDLSNLGTAYKRKEVIAKRGGVGYFETNLETLTLKHYFSFSMKRHVDLVMPTIKAAMVHLTMLANGLNTKGAFENDIQYGEDYIRNKIKNESIVDPKFLVAEAMAQKVKGAASALTLMFSPVQALGQAIQGLWNDISLIIRKPDGTDAFTVKNMLQAAKFVYSDLAHFGDKSTVAQLLNELYGVNDMDMNTYVEKIKSDQHGFHNFSNMMFMFAQRPDFYNRMTIFVAKMINEGCLEAHSINSKGELVYDWRLDKRFNLLLNPHADKNSEAYQRQQALYYAMAKQFEKEGTKNADGSLFKVDYNKFVPLPRAYTNLEAESMKSLSDTIYGYYSHEKKAMVQSQLIGGLWMQFRTYWSGKKNQYLSGGGVRLEGLWKPYTETDANGVVHKFYYQVDPDGSVRYDLPPTETPTSAPVIRWEGNWKEGILATIATLCGAVRDNKSLLKGWDSVYNCEDPNLRNTYKSNLRQLGYDLTMFAIIGPLIAAALAGAMGDDDDYDKENSTDGLKLAAWNVAIKSVNYSYMDFNFIKTITEPGTNWTPFALNYYTSLLSRTYSTAMNEKKSNWDIIINSTAATKVTKPFWDTIKPMPEVE